MTIAAFVALLDDLTDEDWAELRAALPDLERALERLTVADLERLLADQDQRTATRLCGYALPMCSRGIY